MEVTEVKRLKSLEEENAGLKKLLAEAMLDKGRFSYLLVDGFRHRRIKCLTCVEDFTKECVTVAVAFGISGMQATYILDSIVLFRGYPATIRTNQEPEFTYRAFDQWAYEHGVSCA